MNVFMAVPTIYSMLIGFAEQNFGPNEKARFRSVLRDKFRLMVSGSAALPEVRSSCDICEL